jgi:hypothetical protein
LKNVKFGQITSTFIIKDKDGVVVKRISIIKKKPRLEFQDGG